MDDNPGGRRWWQGSTLYQLYVRSWRDTDGDGYGDLGGVIAGLDYLCLLYTSSHSSGLTTSYRRPAWGLSVWSD